VAYSCQTFFFPDLTGSVKVRRKETLAHNKETVKLQTVLGSIMADSVRKIVKKQPPEKVTDARRAILGPTA
jgi:hypothetical protein